MHFFVKGLTVAKSSPKNMGYCYFFTKLPNVNNHQLGENSPTLVTLNHFDIPVQLWTG
jgi:beta-glucosidase/6-phospho-beta-glucosidase/beta-galactosidase